MFLMNQCIQYNLLHHFLPVMQHPKLGLGCLIVEVSRSNIVRYAHPAVLARTVDQPIAEAATYIIHNNHNR
jgi:hypothetical protein